MKRILCLMLLILSLSMLCACGDPPTMQTDFRASFSAQNGDISYSGTVIKEEGTVTVTMSEPYTVNGIAFDYAENTLSIRCGSHSANADPSYLPDNAVPTALYQALTYLELAEYSGSDDGTDSYLIPLPKGEATLTAKDGFPLTLNVSDSGWEFRFSP